MMIFIGNLGNEVSRHHIIDLFSRYGNVLQACVATDDAGNSRGHAYVRMGNAAQGRAAIAGLNKKRFMQQYLSVSESIHNDGYSEVA